MNILEHYPLRDLTTFKIGGPARFFAEVSNAQETSEVLDFAVRQALPLFVLGGGSNILVSDAGFPGVVLHPVNRGINVDDPGNERIRLRVAAGESWDATVACAVEHQWWGLENLSHIPGQAGTAVVQNIGAYGAQISDLTVAVEVLDSVSRKTVSLRNEECHFGYRHSIFNSSEQGRYVIMSLDIVLSRRPCPRLNYQDVTKYFQERGLPEPSLQQIREAIIAIRDSKFPFPREAAGGNAGSFFKNVVLTPPESAALEAKFSQNFPQETLEMLRARVQRAPGGAAMKIPAAFLISICGLKGLEIGGAKVNERQPLVLLNTGTATSHDVLSLAQHLRRTVWKRTGVILEPEPEIVGFSAAEIEEFHSLA
jgi:UDP-N-acetylmuramate dehydrogenase